MRASVGPPASARAASRRELILEATRQLLKERGWHAVGIDEIGAASGITGPGVYRHFESKEALLVAAMEHAGGLLWSGRPPDESSDQRSLLTAYVHSHVDFTLENADIIQLWYQDSHHLPEEARRAQRRLQRRYIEDFVTVLMGARNDLQLRQARVMVRAAICLIHSVAHSDARPDVAGARQVLTRMALTALLSTDLDKQCS
jgi:AcrR family transcriptional regulator